MDKYDLAQYLVNLQTLLESQERTGLEKSTSIAEEYNSSWGKLKDAIKQEKEDETRFRDESRGRPKA